MANKEPNPASVKKQAEESKENVTPVPKKGFDDSDEFQRKTGLDGKTDSGPEPDVHGRQIPPQD